MNEFAKQIKRLQDELLDLKTAQPLAPMVLSYLYSHTNLTTLPGWEAGNFSKLLKIEYAIGSATDTVIFSEFLTQAITLWPRLPDSNGVQLAKWDAITGGQLTDSSIYIMSNVPVSSLSFVDSP